MLSRIQQVTALQMLTILWVLALTSVGSLAFGIALFDRHRPDWSADVQGVLAAAAFLGVLAVSQTLIALWLER